MMSVAVWLIAPSLHSKYGTLALLVLTCVEDFPGTAVAIDAFTEDMSRVFPLSTSMTLCASGKMVRVWSAGAFVAGLDAGHAYNTFPLMAGKLVPDEYWGGGGWRNAFENTAAVQLHHRALALSTLAAVSALWGRARSLPLPGPSRTLVHAMAAMAGLQARTHPSSFAFLAPSLHWLHCSASRELGGGRDAGPLAGLIWEAYLALLCSSEGHILEGRSNMVKLSRLYYYPTCKSGCNIVKKRSRNLLAPLGCFKQFTLTIAACPHQNSWTRARGAPACARR